MLYCFYAFLKFFQFKNSDLLQPPRPHRHFTRMDTTPHLNGISEVVEVGEKNSKVK
jgi:hypothetical protein